MASFRYSHWDGTQYPFADDVPASDLLEELSDDILMGDSPEAALRRLMRRGMQGRFSGLDALRRRLQQRREEEQERLNLAGPLEAQGTARRYPRSRAIPPLVRAR